MRIQRMITHIDHDNNNNNNINNANNDNRRASFKNAGSCVLFDGFYKSYLCALWVSEMQAVA